MSTESDIDVTPNCRILADLSKLKITATFTLTVEQWREFIKAAEKTGGKLNRLMASEVEPLIKRVTDATNILSKGSL